MAQKLFEGRENFQMVLVHLSAVEALVSSVVLAAGFVSSLYVWRHAISMSRDDPMVILQRFISIGVCCILSPLVVLYWTVPDETLHVAGRSIWVWLGITSVGLVPALFLPLLLTAILFIGPLFVWFLSLRKGLSSFQLFPSDYNSRLIHIRNVIVGPFAEEWVFRSCICALLLAGGWSAKATILGSPVLFGVAHLHHLIQLVKHRGYSLQQGIFAVCFQLFYTTLFGVYATFIMIRTGHFVAAFLCHAFCNIMGFPDLNWLSPQSAHAKQKPLIGLVYVLGTIGFAAALMPFTDPSIYHSWLAELASNSN